MKKTIRDNFRVVIEPRSLGNYGFVSISDSMACGGDPDRIEKEYMQRCREIEDGIRRHVDDVGYVSIEFDETEVCSHCGGEMDLWPDDQPDDDFLPGEPCCCRKASEEWRNENGYEVNQ